LLRARSAAAQAPAAPTSRRASSTASYLPDIDSADRHDPLAASEYATAIHTYLRRAEPRFAPDAQYMSRVQREVNEKMRAILVDWLVEVHLKFKLMPETLFLTVNLIDRYLAREPVTRKRLQLVGVTAMLVASKYEEIWAPEVRDFVYISDKAYGRDEILGMEKQMLNALAFDLTVPTPFPFLARYRKAAAAGGASGLALPAGKSGDDAAAAAAAKAAEGRVAHLAQYYSELALVDYGMLQVQPSLLAAGALHLALVAAGLPQQQQENDDSGASAAPTTTHVPCREAAWPAAVAAHSGYTLPEVQRVARALAKLARHAPEATLKAVHKKHGSTRYGEVAKAAVPDEVLLR
jgi:G2/mitotic-specific cyclin-B, other